MHQTTNQSLRTLWSSIALTALLGSTGILMPLMVKASTPSVTVSGIVRYFDGTLLTDGSISAYTSDGSSVAATPTDGHYQFTLTGDQSWNLSAVGIWGMLHYESDAIDIVPSQHDGQVLNLDFVLYRCPLCFDGLVATKAASSPISVDLTRDGTINFPANGVVADGSQVKMDAHGVDLASIGDRRALEDYAYDASFKRSDGISVTTYAQPAQVTIPLSRQQLAYFQASPSQIQFSSYNSSTKKWTSLATTRTVNAAGGATFSAPISKSGTFALTTSVTSLKRASALIVTAASSALVRVYDSQGKRLTTFAPYGSAVTGIRALTGDLNGDGRDEIITLPTGSGPATLKVFSLDGKKISALDITGAPDAGHLDFGLGDWNRNQSVDINVGSWSGNSAALTSYVLLGHQLGQTNQVTLGSELWKGFHLTVGDITANNFTDFVVLHNDGANRVVDVFHNGADERSFALTSQKSQNGSAVLANVLSSSLNELLYTRRGDATVTMYSMVGNQVIGYSRLGAQTKQFEAARYPQATVRIQGYNINGLGRDELVATTIAGAKDPTVRFYNLAGVLVRQRQVYDASVSTLTAETSDLNDDGSVNVITAPTNGRLSQIKIFNYLPWKQITSLDDANPAKLNGLAVTVATRVGGKFPPPSHIDYTIDY